MASEIEGNENSEIIKTKNNNNNKNNNKKNNNNGIAGNNNNNNDRLKNVANKNIGLK